MRYFAAVAEAGQIQQGYPTIFQKVVTPFDIAP
jgi:hypothetical protein